VTALAGALGAALGACLRYAAEVVHARVRAGRVARGELRADHVGLPWATLVVNVVGSAVLGAVARGGLAEWPTALLGAGLAGGLTTFSTFAVDVVRLARTAGRLAAGYVALTVVLGVAAAAAGYALAGGPG